ncbi:MAG: hypothetical protein QXO37_09455 [Candidatus Nitrosocaldaceae archaeon]
MSIEEWIQKLADYSVLGFMVYYLSIKVLNKLDEIERCLDEIKGALKHGR